MLALKPEVALYLVGRYPDTTPAGVAMMWKCAWYWIEEFVSPQYLTLGQIPPVFEAAAIFRMQAVCCQDRELKQSFHFGAAEMLMQYKRTEALR